MSQESNPESTALILEKSFNDETINETTHQKSNTANLGPRHEQDDTLYDAESESESEEVEQKRNGKGAAREYQELQSFPSYTTAIEHMKTDYNNYHFRYTRETEEGDKRYYTCNGFDKCPKTIYLLLVIFRNLLFS